MYTIYKINEEININNRNWLGFGTFFGLAWTELAKGMSFSGVELPKRFWRKWKFSRGKTEKEMSFPDPVNCLNLNSTRGWDQNYNCLNLRLTIDNNCSNPYSTDEWQWECLKCVPQGIFFDPKLIGISLSTILNYVNFLCEGEMAS